jgi:hypothetical protein
MVAYTTSDYTTGWMPGSIKLAALSDTTAETLTPTELLNADQIAFTSGWGFYSGASVTSTGISDPDGGTDAVEITSTGSGGYFFASGTADLQYYRKIYVKGSGSVTLGAVSSPQTITLSSTWTLIEDTQATSAGTSRMLQIQNIDPGDVLQVYAPSVSLADPDRSVNGKGLGVHGSITKTAVATGADLVAYSGFSSSNYLEQPNSIIPTGLNDLLIMGWMKRSSGGETLVSYEHPTAGDGFSLLSTWSGNGKLSLFTGRGPINSLTTFDTIPSGVWNHFAVWRSNQIWYGAVNGVVSAIAVNPNLDDFAVGGNLKVGLQSLIAGNAFGGSLALIRISATVPTADQIRKIYEDEKFLFQENAKATLTGSSDAVTALAHDPDTDLLHVGTSGGRSVFQGLRRVEEHTGTDNQSLAAISAVDGLVVEGK